MWINNYGVVEQVDLSDYSNKIQITACILTQSRPYRFSLFEKYLFSFLYCLPLHNICECIFEGIAVFVCFCLSENLFLFPSVPFHSLDNLCKYGRYISSCLPVSEDFLCSCGIWKDSSPTAVPLTSTSLLVLLYLPFFLTSGVVWILSLLRHESVIFNFTPHPRFPPPPRLCDVKYKLMHWSDLSSWAFKLHFPVMFKLFERT